MPFLICLQDFALFKCTGLALISKPQNLQLAVYNKCPYFSRYVVFCTFSQIPISIIILRSTPLKIIKRKSVEFALSKSQFHHRNTKWWKLQNSNLRPSACKADALPAELNFHMEPHTGGDPALSAWKADVLPLY